MTRAEIKEQDAAFATALALSLGAHLMRKGGIAIGPESARLRSWRAWDGEPPKCLRRHETRAQRVARRALVP